MQYTAIFHGCKNDNFEMKNWDIFSYFVFQNMDLEYTLEQPSFSMYKWGLRGHIYTGMLS